jgi:uncharacterized protein (TIGR01777 family)
MRIIVAGGTGLIGRHLVPALEATGHDVVVLSRRATTARPPGRGRLVQWDGGTADDRLVATIDGAEAIVNLAGVPVGPRPWTRRRRREIVNSRIVPTRTLVAAMARLLPARRPAVLVNASGTDVYTDLGELPATEESASASGFLCDVVRLWEAAALEAESLGVRVVLLRTTHVLAAESPLVGILALPFRLFLGGPLGSGRQWVSWIHVDDIVGLYHAAIETPALAGPLNATAPDARREAEFGQAIAHALQRPARLRVPAWLLRLVLRDQATLVLGSRHVSPAKAMAAGFRFRWTNLDTALADVLGR